MIENIVNISKKPNLLTTIVAIVGIGLATQSCKKSPTIPNTDTPVVTATPTQYLGTPTHTPTVTYTITPVYTPTQTPTIVSTTTMPDETPIP